MGTLFLARHASTAASEEGRNLGQRDDSPLSTAGMRLAGDLAGTLLLELDALRTGEIGLVTSSALRCRQTMAPVAEALRSRAGEVQVEPGLLEIDYGAWEGLTPDECRERDPQLRAAWEADPHATRCPGGESGGDVAARSGPIFDALAAWLADGPGRVAIVVAHNHVNRLHLCRVLGWPVGDYRRRITQAPGGYSIIGYTERGIALRRLNATAFLPDA